MQVISDNLVKMEVPRSKCKRSTRLSHRSYTCQVNLCGERFAREQQLEKHTREVHESLNKTKIHLVDIDPDNEDVLDKFNKMAISEAISIASKKEIFSKGKRKSLADLKDKAGQDHLDWIHSEKAIERMEGIMRGDFASHRHDLFLERKEREQCSGFRLSRLHRLSNPGYLGSGGDIDRADIDRAVIAWLIKVLEANLNTAERNLQMIMDKSIVFTYATAVLFPETFIHQQEALGYSREEAEAIFLHDEIEEDEREALRMELKEAAKEKEEQEADEQNKGEEEEEEGEEDEEEDEEIVCQEVLSLTTSLAISKLQNASTMQVSHIQIHIQIYLVNTFMIMYVRNKIKESR